MEPPYELTKFANDNTPDSGVIVLLLYCPPLIDKRTPCIGLFSSSVTLNKTKQIRIFHMIAFTEDCGEIYLYW